MEMQLRYEYVSTSPFLTFQAVPRDKYSTDFASSSLVASITAWRFWK